MRDVDSRRLSPTAQEALRVRTILAIVKGMSQAEAARVFGVSRRSVNGWHRCYRAGGVRALRSRPRGRPSAIRLAPWQAATTVRLIADRCPDQLKLPFALWTREAVRDLIASRFGMRLSVWTVGRYLNRWGFTPQKPLRRACERDPEAVRQWLMTEYPAIRARARRERATIYWGDEMGLRSDHQAGTSYGRRGATPIIPGTGQRFRCNVISAITNRGKLAFMVFDETFTGVVFLAFLRRLIRHAGRTVVLIVDEHPVHTARRVAHWVARHRRQIRLVFLPGYSPELNPDELLNQDVKTNAVGRRRPRNKPEMVGHVRRYLWSTQRRPHKVRAYFRHPQVRYAAQSVKHFLLPLIIPHRQYGSRFINYPSIKLQAQKGTYFISCREDVPFLVEN